MDSIEEDFQELAGRATPGVDPVQVVLHAIARFPLLIMGLTVVGCMIGLAIGLSKPNTYMSVGMLLVRMGAREAQTPESAVSSEFQVRTGQSGAVADELMMLMDPSLQARVAEQVGVRRLLQPYNPYSMDTEDTPLHTHLLHKLQAKLMDYSESPVGKISVEEDPGEVSPSMLAAATAVVALGTSISSKVRTSTIVVSFTGHDPELAQLVASAYIKVLQDKHDEFYDSANSFSLVTRQLDEALKKKKDAEAALKKQQHEDDIHDPVRRESALAEEIQSLRSQSDDDAVELLRIDSQLSETDKLLATTPRFLTISPLEADPANSPPTESTEDDRQAEDASASVQAKEAAMGSTFQDGSPPIFETRESLLRQRQDVTSQLAKLKREKVAGSPQFKKNDFLLRSELGSIDKRLQDLADLTAKMAEGDTTALNPLQPQLLQPNRPINPAYAALIQKRNDYTIEHGSLQVSLEARKQLLDDRQAELAHLQSLDPIYAGLEEAVAEAKRQVDELQANHTKQSLLALIHSDERMGSLQVSQNPFLPTKKEGPNRLKTLLMGIFGGLGIGIATALARQIMDSRLRYPSDAEACLGLRVLGVVPEQRAWRIAGKKLQDSMERQS